MYKLLLLISYIGHIHCANILFVSLVPSPSHHLWNEALVEGLLTQGHNITLIGFYSPGMKDSNYNVLKIDVERFVDSKDTVLDDISSGESSAWKAIFDIEKFIKSFCVHSLNSEEFKILLTYPKKFFDLLIFDITFSDCYLPLIDHFGKPPVVTVTAFGMQTYINQIIGQRTENYIPYYYFSYTDKMSFFQRFHSVFYLTLERISRWRFLKDLHELDRQIFGENVRKIEELARDISLMFPNDDPILTYPKPTAPNVIPIGGVHVKPSKKLDKDLQNIMDGAKDGLIFVSLGTNFLPKHYGTHAKKAFIETFSKLNLTVLWKFENVEVPKNVIVRKWFSQSDILAHPNTKLFITHCGLLSSQESIIRGVPVIGIPLYADQYNQAGKFTAVKGGVILRYWELTSDTVYNSIMEVVTNPIYKQNMLRLSDLYKQQPQRPMDKFLVWIDYILKKGDLDHLSVASRDMAWYEVDNWDILGFVVTIFILSFMALKRLCLSLKKICNLNHEKDKIH